MYLLRVVDMFSIADKTCCRPSIHLSTLQLCTALYNLALCVIDFLRGAK